MKTLKVRKAGLLIPKRFLKNAEEAIISEENGKIVITPIPKHDPIHYLGKIRFAWEFVMRQAD
jgi:hypothetical protein